MGVYMTTYLERVIDIENAFHLELEVLGRLRVNNSYDLYDYFGFGDNKGPFQLTSTVFDCSAKIERAYNEDRHHHGCSDLFEVELEMLEKIQARIIADQGEDAGKQLTPIIGLLREVNKEPNTTGRLVFWFQY